MTSETRDYIHSAWAHAVTDMLNQFVLAFPECKSTKQCLSLFDRVVIPNAEMLGHCVELWYKELSTLFSEASDAHEPTARIPFICQTLRVRTAASAGSSVSKAFMSVSGIFQALARGSDATKSEALKQFTHPMILIDMLDLEKKWIDPGLDEDAKLHIVRHFELINGYAVLNGLIPADSSVRATSVFMDTLSSKLDVDAVKTALAVLDPEVMTIWASKEDEFGAAVSAIRAAASEAQPASESFTKQLLDMSSSLNLDQCGLDLSALLNDEGVGKLQNIMSALPPGLIQNYIKAATEGDFATLTNPDNFKLIAGICEEQGFSLTDILGNGADPASLLSTVMSSPAATSNPMLQQMIGTMGANLGLPQQPKYE